MKLSTLLMVALVLLTVTCLGADPLDDWGQRFPPGTGYALNAVAFGNGVFVAVGANSTILTSPNGVNWTNTSPGIYGELRNVHFLNGAFNIVGNTPHLFRSTDGTNWTVLPFPGSVNWDIAYGNGSYVVLGNTTFTSSDSTNWVDAAPRVSVFGGMVKIVNLDCIAFGDGKFVAMPWSVNFPEEQGVFHSTNGTNWILRSGPYKAPSPFPWFPSEMIHAAGQFVIANSGDGVMFSSANGTPWVGSSIGADVQSPATGVTYGENYFLALRSRMNGVGATAFFSSTNATSWQQRFPAPGFPGPLFEPRGGAFGNGTFVVVGTSNSNPIIYQSGNVSGAPIILVEPVDRAAVVGNPVTFSILAAGAQPLFYQWQKSTNSIAGATNSVYAITNVVATDTGGYRVIVTNSFGSVTSRVAQLSVAFLDIHEYAGITILGVPGKTYRIEAAPQAGGAWTTLTNILLPQSPYIWIDYDSPNNPSRIYRAAELP